MDIRNYFAKKTRVSNEKSDVNVAEKTVEIENEALKRKFACKRANDGPERGSAEEPNESTNLLVASQSKSHRHNEPSTSQNLEINEVENICQQSNDEDSVNMNSGNSNRSLDYDIGSAVVAKRHGLKQEEIYNYLVRTKTPDSSYKFPACIEGQQTRKFQYKWLQRFKWLAYSEEKKGAFCKYCVLFAPKCGGFGSSQDLLTFVSMPLTKFKKAIEEMDRHSNLSYHRFSEEKALDFVKNIGSQKSLAVDVLLDTRKQKIIENNRKRLGPIVETVLFCSRNNLPLRGHRDSGDMGTAEKQDDALSGKEGIFRSLLAFRMDAGDENLKFHLETAPRNCTLISKTVQNEVIDIIGQTIRSKIVDRIKTSKFYSLICDETTDTSRKIQLTLCVRYVDIEKYVIREDFLGFIQLKSTIGKDIKTDILHELEALGLEIANIRGQGYDGGSNFSGKDNGVRALISKDQPLAFYTHCFSHSLNLCVVSSCEVPEVRNMLGTVSTLINFFTSSSKRTQLLEDEIKDKSPKSKKTHLKTLCFTRWVERHESVSTVCEFLPHIVQVLDNLKYDRDIETSSKATQLLSTIEKSDFLIAIQVVNHVNSPIMTVSRTLQNSQLQISSACSHIEQIIELFRSMRSEDSAFIEIFQKAEKSAAEMEVELKIPRLCSRQKNRANVQTEDRTPLGYFRATIFYPYLDHMITSLTSRFKGEFLRILPLEGLIPTYHAKVAVEGIITAAQIYEEDLADTSEKVLKNEILLWHQHCKNNALLQQCQTAIDALRVMRELNYVSFFPNVAILLQIFSTIPVTSATAERTFSTLKRLKNFLRGNMTENRLNGLALGNVHKDIAIKAEEIVDLFCKLKPRRLETLDWSKSIDD